MIPQHNKKTIVINPELFLVSKSKTRKNTRSANASTPKHTIKPSITASKLHHKLLKRISEIRSKDKENSKTLRKAQAQAQPVFENELQESLNYVTNLKKQQQSHRHKQQIANKTLKDKQTNHQQTPDIFVDTGLPPELDEPSNTFCAPVNKSPINLNYTPLEPPPYGCLKGGSKPSYKDWKSGHSTRRVNNISIQPQLTTQNQDDVKAEHEHVLNREQRLQQIKQKLKQLEHNSNATKKLTDDLEDAVNPPITMPELETTPEVEVVPSQSIDEIVQTYKNKELKNTESNKQYFKHTIKRKFTLGKSPNMRRISVLIKNGKTRKNILNSQKQLKQTDIKDVRKYLKHHGIIKTGSTCPNDILRKTFEMSMLAGEITNTNKDNLLHNYLADTDS